MADKRDKGEVAMRLLRAARADRELSRMSDVTIGELLLEHVWADLDITSPHSALISQAVERLRRSDAGALPPPEDPDDVVTPALRPVPGGQR
jgi:hypothetical protein